MSGRAYPSAFRNAVKFILVHLVICRTKRIKKKCSATFLIYGSKLNTKLTEYAIREESISTNPFDDLVLRESKFSENKLVYRNDEKCVWLYQANCLEFMDKLIAKFPNGKFDMIFADPPYFLSNGGISCHAGKMVSVHKGDWDKSQGAEVNHDFNYEWLKRCQALC